MVAKPNKTGYNCFMKLTTYQYGDGRICHITFPTHLSMVLGIGRPQEFAEHAEYQGKYLTMPEFFEHIAKAQKKDKYIAQLYGVNLPGAMFIKWMERAQMTLQESRVYGMLQSNLHRCYVIGSIAGDEDTLDHELAHAMYFLNPTYAFLQSNHVAYLPNKYRKRIRDYLSSRKYAESTFTDEMHAFCATSSDAEIWDMFNVNPKHRKELRKRFKKEKSKLVKL